MKEEGDWSSERRLPHGRTRLDDRPIISEWDSLPPELVQGIAECALSTTGGVDAYMDMRAVCPSWRSAIARPSPLADLRFRPRHWIMVDLKSKNFNSQRLFLHVPTGRFRRLRLPVLCDHHVLGASDGLIILREKEHPYLARVLNPLTGDILHFASLSWEHLDAADEFYTAVSGGPHPTLVVWRDWKWRWHTVVYADQTSADFTEEKIGTDILTSMVTFQGNVYLAGLEGSVLKFVRPAEQCDDEPVVIAKLSPEVDICLEGHGANSYLVESAGELLLVHHSDQALKVFRVHVEHKLMEEVKNLRCRALFLGDERCVSVDPDKLPSVEGDCIYMSSWVEMSEWSARYMHVYNLRDGTVEILRTEPMLRGNIHRRQTSPRNYNRGERTFTCAHNHRLPPLSLIQVLLDYCNDRTCFYDYRFY